MRRVMSAVFGILLLAVALHAQETATPNLAGTWHFANDETVAAATAAKLIAGPIFGDEFVAEQSATVLTLKISAGSLRVTAIYALDGSVSKNTSPAAGPGAAAIEVTSRAHWDAGRLVITSSSQSPGPTGPVVVESTRTMWLDEQGRLVIDRTGTPASMVPSSRSVYAKQ